MRFPLSWIRQFVPIPEDIEKLSRGFTFSGTEVDEAIEEDGDTIFDFGFTVNRPDLMNVFGLAREASSIFGLPRPAYGASPVHSGEPIGKSLSIEIADPALCPRYRALLIRGAKVGESTPAMKKRLLACGLRPINAVVDATNYVLLEYGHPLHAFDMKFIKGNRIVVRRALPGEKLLMLDGVERKLGEEMLVIADGSRPLVVAGVMGGEEAGVTFLTRDILLEGAVFDPSSIRRTSKALNVHTDASHRYERGVDFDGPVLALEKAAEMITELCGGKLAEGCIDVVPSPPRREKIVLRTARLKKILGIDVPEKDAVSILESLGFTLEKQGEGLYQVQSPSFRVDVSREIDLIEEVTRIHGLDKLPSNLPVNIDAESGRNPAVAIEDEVKARLASKGLSEAIHLSMTDPETNSLFSDGPGTVKISNPLSEASSVLRRSLLPNLLTTVKRNLSYGRRGLSLFEAGRVYTARGPGAVTEEPRLALIFSEDESSRSFNQPPSRDLFALKGVLEFLFGSFGIDAEFVKSTPPMKVFSEDHFLEIIVGGKKAGFLAYLDPASLHAMDIRNRVSAAELDTGSFHGAKLPQFKPFSRFPASKRDISLVVPSSTSWESVRKTAEGQGIETLSRVELIEIYEDMKIGEGMKSVTLSLFFKANDRTLSDKEVETNMAVVISALRDRLGALIRQE
ncbi:MAG TPA: phenylalanine--tRNA ligase subunit beta [Acidobacteriota bacterium]|nr:phenylalanine--tRNA ligase subunit beta [Acidobacteriota bacterium]HNT16543.1 phenylalanine--tRNA ligase subunit beta [Acidobacteriota bacterium]